MIAKKHKNHYGQLIVTVCDSILIGKIIEENDLVLNLNSNYYKGDLTNEKELSILLKEAYIFHMVGEKSINFGINNKIIESNKIKKIGNVPFAESIIIKD